MKKKYNIVCFGFMPWSGMWKRNQSMMAEMAKFEFIERVVFVNPAISLWQVLKQFRSNNGNGLGQYLFPQFTRSNLIVYSLVYTLPVTFQHKVVERIESRRHLKRLQRLNGQTPFILFMNCPNILYPYPLDELQKTAALSIFDFSDDFIELTSSGQGKDFYLKNSQKYAQDAQVVLAVNDYLKTKYAYLNPNIHVIKNATNYDNFQKAPYTPVPLLEKMKADNMPIIGYSGICNPERLNWAILDYLFSMKPDWRFVFVGPRGEELKKRFGQYANFVHLPAVDYDRLPDYLSYFRVAMVPFQINDHTRGNNLLKFHDYLAMGKPVVTTNIGGAEDFDGLVRIADTPKAFLSQIEAALTDDSHDLIKIRKKKAFENSWPMRVQALKDILLSELNKHDSTHD